MHFPAEALKCVVFLGDGSPDCDARLFRAAATGFFVAGQLTTGSSILGLVTAKHCVTRRLLEPFYMRLNGPRDSIMQLVEEPRWRFHADPDVDLAFMRMPLIENADSLVVPSGMMLTEARLRAGDIGPGDLTYTVGLFGFLSGESRNVPLVHSGHIAAFPGDELIEVPDWDASLGAGKYRRISGYVVQCPTVPGASGSPVFVRKSMRAAHAEHFHEVPRMDRLEARHAVIPDHRVEPSGYGAMFLLGMWHGAWEINPTRFIGSAAVRDPSGFGIVVPAQKIVDMLEFAVAEE